MLEGGKYAKTLHKKKLEDRGCFSLPRIGYYSGSKGRNSFDEE